jgi:uncharacterized membrane protein (UPF0136 family)
MGEPLRLPHFFDRTLHMPSPMSLGTTVLLIYGFLMLLGGVMGGRAGSKVSLWAGGASGVVLLVAFWLSRTGRPAGTWIGLITALALCVIFGVRLSQTRKLMPSAMLLAVSLVALGLLVYSLR